MEIPNLFQLGHFTFASKQTSSFKIECDALNTKEWEALAHMFLYCMPETVFGKLEAVPRGGWPLEQALRDFCSTPDVSSQLLIVDDVYTTGESMERQRAGRDAIGWVVFARNPITQPWIKCLFQMNFYLGDMLNGKLSEPGL